MSKLPHTAIRAAEPGGYCSRAYQLTPEEKAEVDRINRERGMQHIVDARNKIVGEDFVEPQYGNATTRRKKLR